MMGGRSLVHLQQHPAKPVYEAATAGQLNSLMRGLAGNQVAKSAAHVVSRFTDAPPLRHETTVRATAMATAVERSTRLARARWRTLQTFEATQNARVAAEVAGAEAWGEAQATRARDILLMRQTGARESARLSRKVASVARATLSDMTLGLGEASALRGAEGEQIMPRGSELESKRWKGVAPPSTLLPRDEFFAELNARLGILPGGGVASSGGQPPYEEIWRASPSALGAGMEKLARKRHGEQEAAKSRAVRFAAEIREARAGRRRALEEVLALEPLLAASLGPSIPESVLMALCLGVMEREEEFTASAAAAEAKRLAEKEVEFDDPVRVCV